ncbi:hypothetical protein CEXT_634341, partial [Caerostris extrusa]
LRDEKINPPVSKSRNGLQKAVFPCQDGWLLLWFVVRSFKAQKNASEESEKNSSSFIQAQSFRHHVIGRTHLELIELKA